MSKTRVQHKPCCNPLKVTCIVATCFLSGMATMGCAGKKAAHLSNDKQLLIEAQKDFDNKLYVDAILKYKHVCTSPVYSKLPSAKYALYRIGYTNLFTDNPSPDFKAALEAFAQFKKQYPDDSLATEAATWVKVLDMVVNNTDQHIQELTERLRKLQNKYIVATDSIGSLNQTFSRYSSVNDSLSLERTNLLKKIADLEQTIVKMEKNR